MLALLLVAVSVGLSNFAASIGIGVAGIGKRNRMRVGVVFGIFEAGMPILGLALGHSVAGTLGHAAHWVGASLLIATGVYGLIHAWRDDTDSSDRPSDEPQPVGRLLVNAIALSIDNLAVGFALGTYHINLALAAVVMGTVSIAMSLAGLELGARIGRRIGQRGEYLGSLVLIGVGILLAVGGSLAR